jgi:hypothetical protein
MLAGGFRATYLSPQKIHTSRKKRSELSMHAYPDEDKRFLFAFWCAGGTNTRQKSE